MNKLCNLFNLVLFFIIIACGVIVFERYKLIEEMNKEFYLLGKNDIRMEYGQKFTDAGFIANVEGLNLHDFVVVSSTLNTHKVGSYEIHYTLTHKHYKKTLTRHVEVVDNQSPTITLVDCEDEVYIPIDGEYKECSYKVSDNYDTDLEDKVIVNSHIDTSKEGDYQISYLVSDSSNNSVSKTVNVHVREKDAITYIKIIISEQHLYYYENNKLVLDTPVTTGKNNYTKTGDFRIRNKVRDTTLKGEDYVSEVKYWMAYNGNSFGIHDASWRRRFGTQDYKWNGSHGCVNVPTGAMAELFSMVEVGTPVYIRN